MFVIDNSRFYCECKEKQLSSNTFGRIQILNKKHKNGEPY